MTQQPKETCQRTCRGPHTVTIILQFVHYKPRKLSKEPNILTLTLISNLLIMQKICKVVILLCENRFTHTIVYLQTTRSGSNTRSNNQ